MPTWQSPLQWGNPWVNAETPPLGRRLFRFYGPLVEGRNVFILNDNTVTENPVNLDEVRLTLYGGHVPQEITVEDAALLQAAGYGEFVT